MDFFNSKVPNPASANSYDGLQTPFVQAINERHPAAVSSSLLTSRLTPTLALPAPIVPSSASGFPPGRPAVPPLPSIPQGAILGPSATASFPVGGTAGSAGLSSSSSSSFPAVLPEQLVSIVESDDILLVDMRSHAQFQLSRILGAVSLVVPTTLLKRANFSLQKIAEMIQDAPSRNRFANWKSANRIVVYDVDASFLSDASTMAGLLRKFQLSGFRGDLNWLKGGFVAFASAFPARIDQAVLPEESQDESDSGGDTVLRTRNLAMNAFLFTSTTQMGGPTPRGSERICAAATSSSSAANPFYDNIRQNLELSQGIGQRIPLVLPPEVAARRSELPFKWLRDIVDQAMADDGDALARQFYHIELGEKRRLEGVMNHHSQESRHQSATANTPTPASVSDYPYSITAGIEMGTKNRYRNIWPYEHARVRLQKPTEKDGSDYVNASFVQSIVSSRRYIATQGPLDSTYEDFWSVCWEQNVSVIVMLTREMESSQIKCGNYWKDGVYGEFEVRLIRQDGAEEAPKEAGGFYHYPKPIETLSDAIVERVLQVTSRVQPQAKPRFVTQLQYLEWSDMDVPSSPAGLLTLIKRVNNMAGKLGGKVQAPPILLHCSAGVGRTGGFILVDSVLAGIRHEMVHKNFFVGPDYPQAMDVDQPESVRSPRIDLDSRPDDLSSHSSRVSPSSNSGSGSESALRSIDSNSTSTSFAQPSSSSSSWSTDAPENGPRNSFSSRLNAIKPRKLSHLVVDKLAKESKMSSSIQIAQWSKGLSTPLNSNPAMGANAYFGDMPSSEEDNGKGAGALSYKPPRQLNQRQGSPPFPSSFVEPVQDVLEDMREQRMSLCQSLRQYVFAHRAIIEGALELVDEAKGVTHEKLHPNELAWSSTSSISSTGDVPPSPSSRARAGRLSSNEDRLSRSPSSRTSSPPPYPRTSTGKRNASPKPSFGDRLAKGRKRKHRNGDTLPTDHGSLSPRRRPDHGFKSRW